MLFQKIHTLLVFIAHPSSLSLCVIKLLTHSSLCRHQNCYTLMRLGLLRDLSGPESGNVTSRMQLLIFESAFILANLVCDFCAAYWFSSLSNILSHLFFRVIIDPIIILLHKVSWFQLWCLFWLFAHSRSFHTQLTLPRNSITYCCRPGGWSHFQPSTRALLVSHQRSWRCNHSVRTSYWDQ